MKIAADDKIPFLRGVFEKHNVEMFYKKGSAICRDDLYDADALIVRTRTECNRALLEGTGVKTVCTATIGTDHVNIPELEELGIAFFSAPGCNAMSVQQYIICALLHLAEKYNISLNGMILGIIGVGHVGSAVADAAVKLGMKVLLNDPPREKSEGSGNFTELAELLAESDFVTVHVPLDDTTRHLADGKFFDLMKKSAFFINSSRGSVCDNAALKYALKRKKIAGAILDVWENEPEIDVELQKMLELGTMHIAGYSADGKANGTSVSVRNIAEILDIAELKNFEVESLPPGNETPLKIIADTPQKALSIAAKHSYDIVRDSNDLLLNPADFEKLRGNYYFRREFNGWTVDVSALDGESADLLKKMNFNIKEK